MRVLALTLAALIAASPLAAAAQAQLSATNLPADGRFALIEVGADDDGPVVGYLRLLDSPPAKAGQAQVWMVVFYEGPRTEEGVTGAYSAMRMTIDCANHTARPDLGLLYSPEDKQVDSYVMEGGDWQAPTPDTPLASTVAVVCDNAAPAGPPLQGLAAARADAKGQLPE